MRKLLVAAVVLGAIFSFGSAWAQKDYTPVKVAAMVKDSVVSIDANSIAYNAIYGMGGTRNTRIVKNKITGFVYTANGYIITDAHQVSKDALISVTTSTQQDLPARVIDVDDDYGVAVLKIDAAKPLTPVKYVAKLYDADKGVYPYGQGDPVVAIGYSGGYGGTVTEGIVSAVRNFRNSSGILVPNMIQSDCVINSGNQGCPLFNSKGEVIAVHDRQGTGQAGLLQRTTFFTPMWLIKRVADEIIANHEAPQPQEDFKAWHPWLGIKPFAGSRGAFGEPEQVGDDLKMFINWPDQYWDTGVWLDTIWPDSPAAEGGIKDHDILYSVSIVRSDAKGNESTILDYQYLKSVEQLETMVTTAKQGDHFIFGVYRNGRTQSREVEIAQHPGAYTTVAIGQNQREQANSQDYF